ncbi:MAG: hypothetical protein RLZ10_1319 [Bacteroidota bacterium]|jgi:hypothetical protein
MATIWTFGDSFTAGDGCVKTLAIRDGDFKYYNEYKESDSDIWPNILGKKIGYDVKNLGKSGASNDYILDSVIDNFNMMELDDVVIIEKTFYQRFDVPKLNSNEFHTQYAEELYFLSIDLENNKYHKDKLEIETILNYAVLFSDNSLFKERQDKRFRFIETVLKDKVNKILMWDVLDFSYGKVETIGQHTNGKIKDYHFSFNGHKAFSELLYKKLYSKPTLI